MAMLAACMLVLSGAAGGTVAWLIGESKPVVNTFTYGNIAVSISESDTGDGDDNPYTNRYHMTPGATIIKDPVVTIAAGSEDAWLFVKMDQSAHFGDFMTYQIADGWTPLEDVPCVWYREAKSADIDQHYGVLLDNAVQVRPEVTSAMLGAMTSSPTLTVTAYAVQRQEIPTALDAWSLIPAPTAP